jgi:copper transport protein
MRRALVVVAVAGLIAGVPATAARAHASLASSEPASGTRVETAPSEITLRFTEQPEPKLSSVRVLDASGNTFERAPAFAGFTMRVPVGALTTGVYTVSWRVVSKADGHTTAGAFAFGFGADVTPDAAARVPPVRTPPPSALEIGGRALFLAGLIALLGAALMLVAIFSAEPRALARLARWSLLASGSGLVLLAEAQRRAAGVGIGTLLGTRVGNALIVRAIALAVAAVAVFVAGARARIAMSVAAVATLGGMFAHVAAGHASADASWSWMKIGAQWIHVAAVGVWIGGLFALLVGIRSIAGEATARAVRRFSTIAGVTLVVVWATGIVRALNQLDSWGQLTSSGYGRVIIAKTALILLLAGFGAINRYRSVPVAHESVSLLRRVSKAEVTLALTAIVGGALLAGLQPPEATAQARAAGVVLEGSDFATTMKVRLGIYRGVPGANGFSLSVRDFDSGEPIDASAVRLRFQYADPAIGTSTLELRRAGVGRFLISAATNISLAGRWTITVVIERATGSVEIPLRFATACQTTAVETPEQPTIYTAPAGDGTMQGYVDPQRAGSSEAHATFFDANGKERPVASASITMTAGDATTDLVPRRLSPGHFVADASLARGPVRFDIVARDGERALRTCFETRID